MIDQALIDKIKSWFDDPRGQCYVASEALYNMVGGKAAGFKPMQARVDIDGHSVSHWWIEDREGNIYDLTAEQFNSPFPYELGVGRGFQPYMKADTLELLDWLRSDILHP